MKAEFLTVQELADVFGVHYQTAWHWVHDGKVPSVRIGSRARIPRQWVEEVKSAAIEATVSPASDEAGERKVGSGLPSLAQLFTFVGLPRAARVLDRGGGAPSGA